MVKKKEKIELIKIMSCLMLGGNHSDGDGVKPTAKT